MTELDIRWEAFEYHTENKSDTFEEMCRRLFTAKYLKKTLIPHTDPNLPGIEVCPELEAERDDGDERLRISFQSKYTDTKNSAYAKFKDSAKKIVANYKGKLDRVYLFSNQALSTSNGQYQEIVGLLKSAQIEAILVCGNDLLDLIAEYPDIAKNYFVEKTYRYIGKGVNVDQRGDNEGQKNTFKMFHIRKLTNDLWVNWKTGCLDSDITTALLNMSQKDIKVSNPEQTRLLPTVLSSSGLRMLSVLVQGEGAVVCWYELYMRGVIMHKNMEKLKNKKKPVVDSYPSIYAKMESIKAIKKLCEEAPVLANIIQKAENGEGYWISLIGTGIQSMSDFFPATEGALETLDWKFMQEVNLKETNPSNKDAWINYMNIYKETWLRRCYADACGTFENRVSNAGGNADTEADVFGDYAMVESYINAYGAKEGFRETEAMLDYVEKWLFSALKSKRSGRRRRTAKMESDNYGNVLVIHGQPGDGKTTFCKKAVYAYCFEGWLTNAPHVLRINLNPQHAGGKIYADGKLDFSKLLCIFNPYEEQRYCCDPGLFGNEAEGSLIILDGYDELAVSFMDSSNITFSSFCESARKFAFMHKWNIIITSRTMCIEHELKAVRQLDGVEVMAFAPMTVSQQALMVERMVEIEKKRGNMAEANSLIEYQTETIPKLRTMKKLGVGRLMSIPILFRMIVTCRFMNIEGIESSAELYSVLFSDMMSYKDKEINERSALLRDYEDIAARIFSYNGNDNGDTCPFGENLGDMKRELIYLFLTKNKPNETGYLGFLHREFYQYFFASYLVSGIQGLREFRPFFLSLRSYPIIDKDVWRLVTEIIQMKRRGGDPFSKETFKEENVIDALECLDDVGIYADALVGSDSFWTGKNATKRGWDAADQAIRNIMLLFSVVERAFTPALIQSTTFDVGKPCETKMDKIPLIDFGRYNNVCEMMRRGKYSGISLEGMIFSGANFSGVDFSNANLRRTKFQEANLSGANLQGADLTGSILFKANLSGTNLQRTNLTDAVLDNANISRANLSFACLNEAHLTKVNLEGARLDGVDLSNAILTDAYLKESFMEGAYLSGADFKNANMENSNMRGAYLEKALLDFHQKHREAPFGEAVLDGAILKGANLRNTFLSEIQYQYVIKKNVFGIPLHRPSGEIIIHNKVVNTIINDMIEFGRYWQERESEEEKLYDSDKTPLTWRIIRREYDKVLIITEKLIECRAFSASDDDDATWGNCILRKWLNETFFNTAFDEEEREKIAIVCNRNLDNKMNVKGGYLTWDRVFLLSNDEAITYLNKDSRKAEQTAFAKEQYMRANQNYWWLRTPGCISNEVSCVEPNGDIYAKGNYVMRNDVNVRPALWLNLY